MKNPEKTNAIRILEQHKAVFSVHDYTATEAVSAAEVAAMLNIEPERVFKTLVTVGKSNEHYVFVVPAERELDLKKAASAVGEKNVSMVKSKELLPLTGYIHGGCSPVGMKKFFKTVFDVTAKDFDAVVFSGGKIGLQVEMAVGELEKIIPVIFADIKI